MRLLDRQRGWLFCWVPVCLGLGIGAYFWLPREPAAWAWPVLCAGLTVLALAGRRRLVHWPLGVALWLVLAGLALAGMRAQLVAAPVLDWRYYGPVQGRVVALDRSASDVPRLTLDRVVLSDTAPARTPARVRVSLHGQQGFLDPAPGMVVILTGHLAPPGGPVEPGGFDFQRMAWFLRLGAVGYTRTPVLLLEPADRALPLARVRMRIASAVRAALPGETGAFAAAITTGDRSGMGMATLMALRDSNLAHLLAISGLHMGLLTGVVFAALRLALACVPSLALRYPCKKIAAVGALAAGAIYLGLSGGNVATQRAFVMVAVMLTAVLVDRRALTLRAVALAATIVLVLRPEALTGPGFQMSFAATTALVAAFAALRDTGHASWPRWASIPAALVLSSFVAGLATAPYAAAHFNRIAHYGLLANLASVPLMGSVVMPGAVLAGALAPVGLGWVGLAMMAPAIDWILGVAAWIAAREGAVGHVVAPSPLVLPMLSLGLLWLVLWRGKLRLAGIVPAIAALLLWTQAERPSLLIAEGGGLVGLATPAGRALSKPSGEGFVAGVWLENDGDGASQAEANARGGMGQDRTLRRFDMAGLRVAHVTGWGAAERAVALCAEADLVITSVGLPEGSRPDCRILDRTALRRSGAVAFHPGADGPRETAARLVAGRRPWNSRQVRNEVLRWPLWPAQ